ncbi:UNVERIFIED_ORG: hypothetical protein ABRZ91_002694 [Heyndrickxia coagulans]
MNLLYSIKKANRTLEQLYDFYITVTRSLEALDQDIDTTMILDLVELPKLEIEEKALFASSNK